MMKHTTPKSKPLPNMSAFSQDYQQRKSHIIKTTPQTPCKPYYSSGYDDSKLKKMKISFIFD